MILLSAGVLPPEGTDLMLLLRFALLLAALAVVLPIDADALVMCAKIKKSTGEIREGTPIRLRDECRPNEVEVDPATLGLQGPPGDPGQPGGDGTDGVDGANGLDGLSCWDTNENLTCDAEEDIAEPFGCGAEDCVGSFGTCTQIPVGGDLISGDSACASIGSSCVFRYRWVGPPTGVSYIQGCVSPGAGSSQDTVLCCG